MKTPSDYVKHLVSNLIKKSMTDFFNEIHATYYSNYDISFKDFFLEIIDKDGEFCIEHTKLVEYGVLTSDRSDAVRRKLDRHNMKEGKDFNLHTRVQVRKTGPVEQKVYYLTPDAFKKCLMNTQKHPSQTINPEIYSDYFLLLEKVHRYYSDYEKQFLLKICGIKDEKIDMLLSKVNEQSIKMDEQSVKIDKLIDYGETITNELRVLNGQMKKILTLYINNGTGSMVFKNVLDGHKNNSSTKIEKLLYPGLSKLKFLCIVPFYKDGQIMLYSIARNLGKSFTERIEELNERHKGWRKIIPQYVSLITVEVNIENSYLQGNEFWENAVYERKFKRYEAVYDKSLSREQIKNHILDACNFIKTKKINNYQKNIYEHDIQDDTDELIINELIKIDQSFHSLSSILMQKYINLTVCKQGTDLQLRDDIIMNGEPVSINDIDYVSTKLYKIIKEQEVPDIVEQFRDQL